MIKVDRLYSTAMVAYYSKQCYLREINTFIFSGTIFQEYAGKKAHFTNSRMPLSYLDLYARIALPEPPWLPDAIQYSLCQGSSTQCLGGTAEWLVHRSYGLFQAQE